ncbi:DNA-directed RNA polymerase subunit alpha [Mycoplasma capricolum subsp. capripneumoniae]|uniref:DNA-directed RNA polymerase subunit alpha n=1 Tax=Mycoplasma capricolum subsp. capripneumoniae 87001 TaxID=1124992 RepID=A0A9N7G8X7_MYCCC|nr:DNA-directed RNA polymerase subunit alpha [Mycoplasma capricolum]AJK51710.1 DNA-directed RNA polymerase subunit alpha [Mycoplasma capricolum subsp. capripneumoniae 87001]AOQ22333.1 DNA-directed RNA polymerase subunit alpha [Mycoplasma capricolum subsp. capripneumoniae M1601]AQU77662.1 DNA-directed RNA polymerase subunit alpha [Mycoplasma capricolum subsp. capripneumoniae]KEY84700.1 DNA-directed RNA polymerase alpha chain [Mycoplasma capricolum subsp. capripneumoniae 99108]QDL19793.1 DNA-dir
MKQFVRPEFILLKEGQDKNYGKFSVSPLERGFGITLGNAIRRTLLAATPGASVYAIKIAGATHEFTSIPGIIENVTKIILNIKQLVLRIDTSIYSDDEVVQLKIRSDIQGSVYAGDLELPAGVEVLNQDLLIATISEGGILDLVLYAKNSRGYKTFKDNKNEKNIEPGMITIDSNYSPIIKVAYSVDSAKIGRAIDLEKLELEVTTDGSITAIDAISIASKILVAHLEFFIDLNREISVLEVIGVNQTDDKELDRTVEELDFTQRSLNCLKRAGINTLRELVTKNEDEISSIRNLGRKSLKEIKDKVASLGLAFRQS